MCRALPARRHRRNSARESRPGGGESAKLHASRYWVGQRNGREIVYRMTHRREPSTIICTIVIYGVTHLCCGRRLFKLAYDDCYLSSAAATENAASPADSRAADPGVGDAGRED